MSLPTTLLDEMDAQQNAVLEQLDELNGRILQLIQTWQAAETPHTVTCSD